MNFTKFILFNLITIGIFSSTANAIITAVTLRIEIEDEFNAGGVNILQRSTASIDNSSLASLKVELGEKSSDLIQTQLDSGAILFGDFHDNDKFSVIGNELYVGYERVTIRATGISFDDPTKRIISITDSNLSLLEPLGPSNPITYHTPVIDDDGKGFTINITGTNMIANGFSFTKVNTYVIGFGTIPEPSSMALLLLSGVALLLRRKR